MKYSSLVERIAGESAEVWDIHNEARKRFENGEDVIMLSIGEESDEKTPASIQKEAIASIQRGRHHYTQVVGEDHLRKAIAKIHQQRTSQQVKIENVSIFFRSSECTFFCLPLPAGKGRRSDRSRAFLRNLSRHIKRWRCDLYIKSD